MSVVERDHRTVELDEHDRLRLPGSDVSTHSGGVGRHARKCQPDRFRTRLEQARDRTDRNVPLDDVALDESRVARPGAIRNAMGRLECGELRIFGQLDRCVVSLQVPDPLVTAPSTGLLVDLEGDAR